MRKNIQNRMGDFMAMKQVNHQLTSVNQNIKEFVERGLGMITQYFSNSNYRIQFYHDRFQREALSIWTEIIHTTRFTMKLIFARPAVRGMGSPCDMGALCM